jgi:hypothetical protein
MKMKTILGTLLISAAVVGCGTTGTATPVDNQSVSQNTIEAEAISDNSLDLTNSVDLTDEHDHSPDINGEVLSDGTYIVESMLREAALKCYLPEGMEVHYSDEYSIEFVRPFAEDVSFEFVDEEMGVTYHDEVVYVDFNNVRNTPFVESRDYLKAQLMNTGYNNVTEFEIGDRSFIIAYSEINKLDEATAKECFPKTSICCLEIVENEASCPEEDCTHTEVIELLMYVHDLMDGDDVIEYVTGLINEGSFSMVEG